MFQARESRYQIVLCQLLATGPYFFQNIINRRLLVRINQKGLLLAEAKRRTVTSYWATDPQEDHGQSQLNPGNDNLSEMFIFQKQCNLQSSILTYYINITYYKILTDFRNDKVPLQIINSKYFKLVYQDSHHRINNQYHILPEVEYKMFYEQFKLAFDEYTIDPTVKKLNLNTCFSYQTKIYLEITKTTVIIKRNLISKINSAKFFRHLNTVYIKSNQCDETISILIYKSLMLQPLNRYIFVWKDMTNRTNQISFNILNQTDSKRVASQAEVQQESVYIFCRFLLK
uniref:Uncharacterized protein n=1 Tax=Spironucleus salmonicida TaxID=348837 RepID=V6LKI1_9EUKA|eukprot:EST44858.1 Hypothetical protein SS50377_15238 [Spironucleus salmonicida]